MDEGGAPDSQSSSRRSTITKPDLCVDMCRRWPTSGRPLGRVVMYPAMRGVRAGLLATVCLGLIAVTLSVSVEPVDAASNCKPEARTLSYTDTTTNDSIQLRAGSANGRLIFRTGTGKTMGGDGARVRISEDRVTASFSTRDVTILVHGIPKIGLIVASAVSRVHPKVTDGVDIHGRKFRLEPLRTTYTFATGSGAAIQIGCGG